MRHGALSHAHNTACTAQHVWSLPGITHVQWNMSTEPEREKKGRSSTGRDLRWVGRAVRGCQPPLPTLTVQASRQAQQGAWPRHRRCSRRRPPPAYHRAVWLAWRQSHAGGPSARPCAPLAAGPARRSLPAVASGAGGWSRAPRAPAEVLRGAAAQLVGGLAGARHNGGGGGHKGVSVRSRHAKGATALADWALLPPTRSSRPEPLTSTMPGFFCYRARLISKLPICNPSAKRFLSGCAGAPSPRFDSYEEMRGSSTC